MHRKIERPFRKFSLNNRKKIALITAGFQFLSGHLYFRQPLFQSLRGYISTKTPNKNPSSLLFLRYAEPQSNHLLEFVYLAFHISNPIWPLPDFLLLNCPFLNFSAVRFSSLSMQTFEMLARSRIITPPFHPLSPSAFFSDISFRLPALFNCYFPSIILLSGYHKAPQSFASLFDLIETPSSFITTTT